MSDVYGLMSMHTSYYLIMAPVKKDHLLDLLLTGKLT